MKGAYGNPNVPPATAPTRGGGKIEPAAVLGAQKNWVTGTYPLKLYQCKMFLEKGKAKLYTDSI